MAIKTDTPPSQSQPSGAGKRTLIAIVGTIAAAGLFTAVPKEESGGKLYLKAYQDSVGVWTICDGITKGVTKNMVQTPEGCKRLLEQELIAHAEPVMKCTPRLKGRDYETWAAVQVTYNIGTGAYCKSSIDREFDAGRWASGCDRMLYFNKGTFALRGAQQQMARGEKCTPKPDGKFLCTIKGLTDRRKRERAICLKGTA